MPRYFVDADGFNVGMVVADTPANPGKLTIVEADDPPAARPEPPKTPEQVAAAIKEQIVTLERAQLMPRATREFMLTLFKAQAEAGGITEAMLIDPQHPAYSAAYAKLKAFDSRIVELRAQL